MRDLVGKDVWISAGGQMDYYRDSGNHVNFAAMTGTLPGAEDLLVKGIFEQAAPTTGRAVARLGPAQKYVMLAFTGTRSTPTRCCSMTTRTRCITGGRRCGRSSTSTRPWWG